MKHCNGCGDELSIGVNWSDSMKRNYNYTCRSCHSKSGKKDHKRRMKDPWFRARRNEQNAQFFKDNPGKACAKTARRRAKVLGQTPDMNAGELTEIDGFYMYNQIFEGKWHVDHIDPIDNGGLHHPSNLQILSEHDNCSKGPRI